MRRFIYVCCLRWASALDSHVTTTGLEHIWYFYSSRLLAGGSRLLAGSSRPRRHCWLPAPDSREYMYCISNSFSIHLQNECILESILIQY